MSGASSDLILPGKDRQRGSTICTPPLSKSTGGAKQPYWIHLKDDPWMGFAGLYTWWKSPEGEWVPSATIVTTTPNNFTEPIHDRMPVILTEGAYDVWLSPGNSDLAELKEVLVPYPSGEMRARKVATLVNNVKNDRPELIESEA